MHGGLRSKNKVKTYTMKVAESFSVMVVGLITFKMLPVRTDILSQNTVENCSRNVFTKNDFPECYSNHTER